VKAIKNANEALALNPSAWKSMIRLAEATILSKDYEKAILICDRAIQHVPTDDEIVLKNATKTIKAVKQNAVALLKVEVEKQRNSFKHIFGKSTTNTGKRSNGTPTGTDTEV